MGRMTPGAATELLRFAGCTLDARRGVLTAPDGTMTTLRPKTTELAVFLFRNSQRVVSRTEILDAVWPSLFVTDDNVTQCVTELRKALREAAPILRTLPRRGYVMEAETASPTLHALVGAPSTAATEATAAAPHAASMRLLDEGWSAVWRPGPTRETRLEARTLFERAIALDPRNAYALFAAALAYANQIHAGGSLNPEADLQTAAGLAERALAIDPTNSGCHAAMGAVRRLQRRNEEALFHFERAVALDPVAHPSRANAGFTLLLLGRGEEGLGPVLAALAAAPNARPFLLAWHTYAGLIELHTGAGDQGVAHLRAGLNADFLVRGPERMLYLAAALWRSGDDGSGRILVQEVAKRSPGVTLSGFAARPLSDHPNYLRQFAAVLDALAAAGLRG